MAFGGFSVWSIEEAQLSETQIGPSACGATAVINSLRALGIADIEPQKVNQAVGTRLRSNDADVVEYLRSRSVAGATIEDLVRGLDGVASEKVQSLVYYYNDEHWQNSSFVDWCQQLMQLGAVLILTLNLQQSPIHTDSSGRIPDAWHHQMIFGAIPPRDLLLLTNPVEALPFNDCLRDCLSTASVLLVRSEDVVSRLSIPSTASEAQRSSRIDTIVQQLNALGDRWQELNVGKQLENVIKSTSTTAGANNSDEANQYLRIPAAYRAGALIITNRNNTKLDAVEDLIPK